MFDDQPIRFVSFKDVGIHILVGEDDEHHGLSLCGEQHTWVDGNHEDTWKTITDFTPMLVADVCGDCFATMARVVQGTYSLGIR